MLIYGKEGFIHWLKNRGLSDSSISKYAKQADNRIKKDLGISFYSIKDIDKLSHTTELRQLISKIQYRIHTME